MPSAIWLRAELPVHKINTLFFSAIAFALQLGFKEMGPSKF